MTRPSKITFTSRKRRFSSLFFLIRRIVYETNESALLTFVKNVFFENVVVSLKDPPSYFFQISGFFGANLEIAACLLSGVLMESLPKL